MRTEYIYKDFKPETLDMISAANAIIEEYQDQGFSLTLRQLYYQFVARDMLPNTERSYKRLGSIINNGRLAGLIDWEAIEDRTRNLEKLPTWESPAEILRIAEQSYREDKWAAQDFYVEVWIEKEALTGVIEGICDELQVPYFACRGYTSQSEQWRAGLRFSKALENRKRVRVFHLGDHDPSGVDMTRDNEDRLGLFAGRSVYVDRLALNMGQILELGPPPNPTKLTDSRAGEYLRQYGGSSWELDALEPSYIVELIESAVLGVRDEDVWEESLQAERENVEKLRKFREGL